jgi:hypothetical protein
MAYGFTASPQANITGTYTSHLGLTKFTLALWIRRDSSGSQQGVGFNSGSGVTETSHRSHITHFTDNRMYFVICNGSSTNGNGNTLQNITGWNHWAMVFDGTQPTNATRLNGYVNGVSQSLTFSGSIPSSLSSNAVNQQLNIGWNRANNVYSVGAMAEFSTWEDALTAEEIASLSKGFTPSNIRPDKLLSHIPLLRNLQDVVAANALTNTSGNATVANHPRVYA